MVLAPRQASQRQATERLQLRRVALVNVGAYISVYGLRKLAPAVREIVPDTTTFYVSTGAHLHSVKNVLLSSKKDATNLNQADLEAIAAGLSGFDVIGFSVMTIDSEWAKKIIAEVRKASPETYIVIGGMIEYVFVRNHTRGEELALLTWGLVLFIVDVPLILGFSVARYQRAD